MAKEENLFEEKAKEEGGKPAANTDKLKALRAAMDKIEKNYGNSIISIETGRWSWRMEKRKEAEDESDTDKKTI